MRFHARIWLLVCAVSVIAYPLLAGGKAESSTSAAPTQLQTISVWSGQDDPGENAVKALFAKTHANAKLEWNVVPYSDYATKAIAAAKTNDLPDVLFLQPRMPATYGKLGFLKPVTKLVSAMGGKSTFSEQDLHYNTVDGEIWGVPYYSYPHLLFYRADWFAAAGIKSAPTNWTEFREDAKKLTTANRVGYIAFLADPSVGHLLHQWMGSAGADTFGPKLTLTIDGPKTIEVLNYLYGLYKDGYMSRDVVSMTMDDARLAFLNGQGAMLTTSTSFITTVEKSDILPNVKAVPIPENGGKGNYYAFRSLSISKDARDEAGAENFIKWLNEDQTQTVFFENGRLGYIPANRNYINSGEFWKIPRIAKVRNLLEGGIAVNKTGGWFPGMEYQINEYIGLFDTQNIYQNMLIKMITDGISAQEAVAWAKNQMQQIMSR